GFLTRALLGFAPCALFGFLACALLLGAEHRVALGDHLADGARDQSAGADRIVIAGNHVVDAVRVAVGVHEADDWNSQPLCVARLLLGAHEEHRAATMGERARELLRLFEQRRGLEEVDDVNAGALSEDEAAHLRIPATRLMAEVDTGLPQLCDSYLSQECILW